MKTRRIALLAWCSAIALLAFICLDFWQTRNAPLYRRLELKWDEDVKNLEHSKKLPAPWYHIKDLEIEGGTAETRAWLHRIHVPLKTEKNGQYKMDVLVVAWEEEGTHGALIQYNLVELKTGNNIWELGRTLILSRPRPKSSWKAFLQELQ
jgi:hypothetical protein